MGYDCEERCDVRPGGEACRDVGAAAEAHCDVRAGEEAFSLLKSNHASDSAQPCVISRAIGGSCNLISMSIMP